MSAVKKVPGPNSQSPPGSEANLCPGEPPLLVCGFVAFGLVFRVCRFGDIDRVCFFAGFVGVVVFVVLVIFSGFVAFGVGIMMSVVITVSVPVIIVVIVRVRDRAGQRFSASSKAQRCTFGMLVQFFEQLFAGQGELR